MFKSSSYLIALLNYLNCLRIIITAYNKEDFYEYLFCVGVPTIEHATQAQAALYVLILCFIESLRASRLLLAARSIIDHLLVVDVGIALRKEVVNSPSVGPRRIDDQRYVPAGQMPLYTLSRTVHRANDIRRNPCDGRRTLYIWLARHFTATRCNVYELVIVRLLFPPYYNDSSR